MVVSQSIESAYVIIDEEKCKGCCFCISFCPKKILTLAPHINQRGDTPVAVIAEKAHECTGCLACAIMCPDVAISVYRNGVSVGKPIS